MERSGCQRKNNVFAFHSDAEIKDQEKKWCLITPLQGGVWKAGGTGALVTVLFWKQGEEPAGSVAITNACAGGGQAAVSASPAGPREPAEWGFRSPCSPSSDPRDSLGEMPEWFVKTASPHVLRAQTSKQEGGVPEQCWHVMQHPHLSPQPPRTHLCQLSSLD